MESIHSLKQRIKLVKMFLRVEMSIIKNTTFDHHAMSRNFSEICVPFESAYFLSKGSFFHQSPLYLLCITLFQRSTSLANISRIHSNGKSFEHFHQLKQKCLWKPQVNVRTHDRSLTGILDALIVKALATWLVNVFSISALLSSLIECPLGGSGAVRISLASEVGYHCFVEVLFDRKFVFPLFSPGMCTSA